MVVFTRNAALTSADHPEPQVGGVRSLDHLGAFEVQPAAQMLEQPGSAAEQDRGQMDLDLVQQPGSPRCERPKSPQGLASLSDPSIIPQALADMADAFSTAFTSARPSSPSA
jgi:hypothetical protein